MSYCSVERQLSANTREAYRYDLADLRKRNPVRFKSATITTEMLRKYLEDMTTSRSLSTSTVRRRIARLRSFFRYLEMSTSLPIRLRNDA
ncbi:site-specific integrase [Bradyrhizobium sp. ARR65]|uniref:site-specific integrase n=1 Tax=Bradyrhizobium sp. ARR65 TaxID=1040989 RepID=UPI0012FBCC8F|nr:site-specific integrase [Bradyrhizobium sp. ARR65]